MSAAQFPARLEKALSVANRTQQWLASKMGRTQGTVSHWCSGRSRPTWEDCERMAALLGCDPGTLVFGPRRVRPARAPARVEPATEGAA